MWRDCELHEPLLLPEREMREFRSSELLSLTLEGAARAMPELFREGCAEGGAIRVVPGGPGGQGSSLSAAAKSAGRLDATRKR
jgi:hypothetical protein